MDMFIRIIFRYEETIQNDMNENKASNFVTLIRIIIHATLSLNVHTSKSSTRVENTESLPLKYDPRFYAVACGR